MKRKESRTSQRAGNSIPRVVVHVPHAAVAIPEKWRDKILLDEESLRRELIRMTDWYTDDLFGMEPMQGSAVTGEAAKLRYVRAPYSRLACDMERFRDPAQEGMTAKGMWICYEKTADGLPLKEADAAHIEDVLAVYDRHHASLTKACEDALRAGGGKADGRMLLIDAHSFPSVPLPYELADGTPGAAEERPDFCLGTDPVHTPPALAEAAKRFLEARGYTVAFNTPFAGVLVPMAYYRKEPRVQALMIEVNRSLYIDERTAEKLPDEPDGRRGYRRTKHVAQALLEELRACAE